MPELSFRDSEPLILPLLRPADAVVARCSVVLPPWPAALGPPSESAALAAFALWASRLTGKRRFALSLVDTRLGADSQLRRLSVDLGEARTWPQAQAAAQLALASARDSEAEALALAFLVAEEGASPPICPGTGLELVWNGSWSWRYQPVALEKAAAARLADLLRVFVEALAADPGQQLTGLPTVGLDERRRLLELGHGQRHPPPSQRLLHALVLEQAARTPDRLALSCGQTSLTYGELASRVSRLAHHLRALGVFPEMPVGVCLERGPDLVISLLAILTAGGAYLPLDPAYPEARIRFALEDAQAFLVLVQASTLSHVSGENIRRLQIDGDEAATIATRSTQPPREQALPENLAYLIYTSGSTGRAKGVAICHANAAEMVAWAHRAFSDEESAVVYASTSICFDISVFELFATLARGGEVVLAAHDLFDFATDPHRTRVTLLNTVPSVLAELMRSVGTLPPSVVAVNLAGEPLPGTLAAALHSADVPHVRNLYGPSEDTTYSTWSLVPRGEIHPSIGGAVDNTRAYVLDGELDLCPEGLAGELYLAGAGLSRGYLGRPALTAERYIPDPFAEVPGARMYRTGDLVRWRDDGELAFLGRLDYQVKVRGFRIELGEIEATLCSAPGVEEAVAVAWRANAESEPLLVAWVAGTATQAALRGFLAERLPTHMIPAYLSLLAALPRLPNGKVDPKALPTPVPFRERPLMAPRGDLEQRLALLWAEVMGLSSKDVSRDDVLATLGGHSLSAMRVVAQLKATFGISLAISDLAELTLAELAERIGKSGPRPAPPLIRTAGGPAPLSPAQQRLVFFDRLYPGHPVYNVSEGLLLQGPLDIASLGRALDALVLRHAALRTSLRTTPSGDVETELEDQATLPLRQITESELQAAIEEPFELARGPLVRAFLARRGEKDHLLVLSLHHIVTDGWSMEVLFLELAELYEQARLDSQASGNVLMQSAGLTPLPFGPGDVARWMLEQLDQPASHAQIDYWRRTLGEELPTLDLSTDFPRPAVASLAGHTVKLQLDAATTTALKTLADTHHTTLFGALLATYVAFLFRLTGQKELVVGIPTAGRNDARLERMVGFFVNLLPLRFNQRGRPSFGELLVLTRDTLDGALANAEIPFDRLVEALNVQPDRGRHPIFQTLFAMETSAFPPPRFKSLVARRERMTSRTAKADLVLYAEEKREGGVDLWLEGSADLFSLPSLAAIARRFVLAASALAARATRPLSEFELVSAEERLQLEARASARPPVFEVGALVHQQVVQRAAMQGARPALRHDETTEDYAALVGEASRLAQYLRTVGIAPEVGVALLIGRTPRFVKAALATLLAGGYYVPLDPALPDERLEFMLSESGAAVLLTGAEGMARVRGFTGTRIHLDADAARWKELAGTPPQVELDPDHLAYLIFTSGSTGRPKGVAVCHRGLANLVAWHLKEYALGPGDRCSFLAGLGFDASVWELWPPLVAGATLCLAPESVRSDPAGLIAWLKNEGITHGFLPTPLAEAVLAEETSTPSAGLEALRVVLTGGEALHRRPRQAASFALFNHYGPTEATVVATAGQVEAGDSSGRPPAIGWPIAGIEAWVLDANLQLVPSGMPGELFLGGQALARGYRRQPALTAAAFVPNPFSKSPGARLYATGDRVRWLADDSLDFIGRTDNQIKIRGHRIELGEIESELALIQGLRQSALRVFAGPAGKKLVGYVAIEPDAAIDGEWLRRRLAERLPAAMVPESWVFLPALPLTANGKIDRQALAEPQYQTSGSPAEAPRTTAEEAVAAMFSELLGFEKVSRQDSFFELGGHSLLATRAVARLNRIFGVDLGVADLFEAPRVADLAHRLTRARHAASDSLLRADRAPKATALPLSSPQERLYFLAKLAPESPFYNVPEVLDLVGSLDPTALEGAIHVVVDRHRALWARFRLVDGRPVQDLDRRPSLVLRHDDLTILAESEREARCEALTGEEIGRIFDLEEGPLLRARLIRSAAEKYRLVLTVHHLVFDGWSADVLLEDLALAYRALAADQEPMLAPLPLEWADYLLWQERRQESGQVERELEPWRQLLAGAPPALELPTDRPRPATQRFRGGIRSLRFPAAACDRLEAIGQGAGATLFMTLLALFETLLFRLTGQKDQVIGVPFAGRDAEELESQVGFFVNTLALRVDLGDAPSFKTLLERIRKVALAVLAHPDVPFDRLVEELASQPGHTRDFSRSPIFQVIFVCPQPRPALDLGGIASRRVTPHTGSSKFDLSLFLGKAEDGDGLEGFFEYDSDLFEHATIERFAGHLGTLLEAVVAAPDQPISRLPMLQAAEVEHLARLQSAAGTTGPADTCLHQLLWLQAERTPDATALVHHQEAITYRELMQRAQELAALLRARGVRPEERVGVCLPRTAELPLALLAVLLAGGAYLPLDPAYPDERLTFMQQDARAILTITTRELSRRLGGGPYLLLDELPKGEASTNQRMAIDPPTVLPSNLAYLIYTSGSTGRAKGVAIEHRQAVAMIRWAREVFGQEELAGTVAATSVCFDLSVFEIFLPLAVGGTVIMVENALDLAASTLGPIAPTLVNTVPSAMAEALRMGALPASVQTVNLAGEPLPGNLAAALYEAGVARVYNLYGPSEDTTYSTVELVPRGEKVPTIGVPIRGTTGYVLDAELQPTPVGVKGELFLGGEGLSRGYLGRPALTAERYLPDPFAKIPGARLYRSGDRVLRRPDDRLAYFGRTDHQVKIRGFRIEPGEVQEALEEHPQVAAAVVATEEKADELRLVAWVERKAPAKTGRGALEEKGLDDAELISALRRHLAAKMPAHMVPSAIVVLAQLPRLPNGKVDRKSLPPVIEVTQQDTLAPRTPLESVLARLWAETLGLSAVGVEDDFFSLGGHSLLAVRLLAQIQEELLLAEIPPLASFFAARTIAGLAEHLLRGEDPARLLRTAELLMAMENLSDEEVAFLVSANEGMTT